MFYLFVPRSRQAARRRPEPKPSQPGRHGVVSVHRVERRAAIGQQTDRPRRRM